MRSGRRRKLSEKKRLSRMSAIIISQRQVDFIRCPNVCMMYASYICEISSTVCLIPLQKSLNMLHCGIQRSLCWTKLCRKSLYDTRCTICMFKICCLILHETTLSSLHSPPLLLPSLLSFLKTSSLMCCHDSPDLAPLSSPVSVRRHNSASNLSFAVFLSPMSFLKVGD